MYTDRVGRTEIIEASFSIDLQS